LNEFVLKFDKELEEELARIAVKYN